MHKYSFMHKYDTIFFNEDRGEQSGEMLSLEAAFSFSLISIGSCSFSAWVDLEEVGYLASDEC